MKFHSGYFFFIRYKRSAFFQLNYSHLKKSSLHFSIVVWIDSLPFNTCAHKVYAVNHLHYKIFFKLLVGVVTHYIYLEILILLDYVQ